MNLLKKQVLHGIKIILLLSSLAACRKSMPAELQSAYQSLPDKIDFNFHIRPLLADRCFACHGPDDNTREADLRLDLEEGAFAHLKESDGYPIVGGSLGKSKVWQRIISDDPDFQMPPPDSHLSLTTEEKALIGKWIEQGAEWKEHWAFIPPERPVIPELPEGYVAGNPIDHFIQARLAMENGLIPSPEADRERLIRRLSFDLRGLPPSIAEVEDFMAGDDPKAYEKLIDRMMKEDAFAERMAMEWLDVARFGDTQGMHLDPERLNWPWRDWVIQAFRENMPYDEFIIWQMAGDLLPQATREQKLATSFHRNHPTSSEGGVKDPEFIQKYVQDRTNTTATAFMGLTLECASCHDHKFDPISQKEYYQMTAYFNNLNEIGMVNEFKINPKESQAIHGSGPVLPLPDANTEIKLLKLDRQIDAIRRKRKMRAKEVAQTQSFLQKISQTKISAPKADAAFPFEKITPYKTDYGVVHRSQNNRPIDKMVDNNPMSLACGDPQLVPGKKGMAIRSEKEVDIVFVKETGTFELNEPFSAAAWIKTEQRGKNQTIMGTSGEMGNAWRGWDFFLDTLNRPSVNLVSLRPHNYLQITADISIAPNEWHHLAFTYEGTSKADGVHIYVDGKKVKTHIDYDDLYRPIVRRWRKNPEFETRPMMVFRSGRFHLGENGVFTGSIDEIKLFRRYLSTIEVGGILAEENEENMPALATFSQDHQWDHYLNHEDSVYKKLTLSLQYLLGERLNLIAEVPEVMVMEDMPEPRQTFVLDRGQYDRPTEAVNPATPAVLISMPDHYPKNRLGLALWLTKRDHPLTARVAVNRYWQMIFGRGLVETPHDFGTQGALPTHPELLDWLAIEFMESGWDVRALLKTMLMSATYRQSSIATDEQLAIDPKNILLARGPSHRLQAEMIRDNALAASGLLIQEVGGPSVKPYQPDGIWDFGGLVSGNYEADSADNLYRRSLYTYLRRTSPHPAMVAFDAPNRLVCITKRENTNTPLQALVLLNDPQFVEAARVLAARMQKEGGNTTESQIQYGFRLLCGRRPDAHEMKSLQRQYQLSLERYRQDKDDLEGLLAIGEYPLDEQLDKTKTAALTMVANTMMNFDEAYMKR